MFRNSESSEKKIRAAHKQRAPDAWLHVSGSPARYQFVQCVQILVRHLMLRRPVSVVFELDIFEESRHNTSSTVSPSSVSWVTMFVRSLVLVVLLWCKAQTGVSGIFRFRKS